MISKRQQGDKQRDPDSEKSVTGKTIMRKRPSPAEDTEHLTSIKKNGTQLTTPWPSFAEKHSQRTVKSL